MTIELTNIGMLHEAKVEINGLTVIAGENDTGKSTVGKTIFSVIKALSRAESDLDENKEDKIRQEVSHLYRYLQIKLPPSAIEHLLPRRELLEGLQYSIRNDFAQPSLDLLDNLADFVLKYDLDILKPIARLKQILQESNTKQDITKRALQKALNSTFLDEFSNKKDKKSHILLSEFGENIFEASIHNGKVDQIIHHEELFFRDATYIETPFVLDLSEQIRYSVTHFDLDDNRERLIGRGRVSLRVKDLIDKLTLVHEDTDSFFTSLPELSSSKNIFDTIGGQFHYKRKSREFIFKKEHSTFKSLNVASGLKCFGLLQMLDRNGFLDDKSLLILDEPEVHLHPKWQLAYAQVIVELVENGVQILLNSHSPYMIEALKRFSEEKRIQTNFYLAENNSIIPSENALGRIFEKLSEPFAVFDEMDSNKLHG